MAAGCSDTKEPDNIIPPPDGSEFSKTFIQQEPIETVAVQWTAAGAAEARPLDSETRLDAATPSEFIRNGYRNQEVDLLEEPPVMNANTDYGYRPVFKPLDDLTADDLTLIAYKRCYLIVPAGELTDGGTLNVTVTTGSQTLSATLDLAPIQ